MNNTVEVDLAQTRVAEGTLAFLYGKYPVEYNIALKFKDANGVPTICQIKDDFAFNLNAIHVPKSFWLKVNLRPNLTFFLLQAGLVNWWWEQLKYIHIYIYIYIISHGILKWEV
jgi:hypothetical protein